MKYSFVNFLSIFSSFQSLNIVRFAKNMKKFSVSEHVHMRRDTSSPCTQLYAFWMTPSPSLFSRQLCVYVIDGLFLNQKTKTFQYRIQWNINIRTNKFLYEKIYGVLDEINIQKRGINQKSNNAMPVVLCNGATSIKENCCLATRIVSFHTAGLHLLTFRILESNPFKDIDLDLSHVIWH